MLPAPFAIDTQSADGQFRVEPRGEIDVWTGPQLEAHVRQALEREGAHDLVIDLGDVSFIDAAGIASVRRCLDMAPHGGRCLLAAPRAPAPRRTLDLAGFWRDERVASGPGTRY
jgi:anti-sigma B factor antagonist